MGTLNSIKLDEEKGMAVRFSTWTIALSALVFSVCSTEAGKTLPGNPDYFCYVRSGTQVINLNSMCQQNPALSVKVKNVPAATASVASGKSSEVDAKSEAVPIEVKPEASRKVAFSELNYEGGVLLGSVRNKSGKPMGRANINFKVYAKKDASNWKLIGTGRALTIDEDLKPGKTTSFEASTRLNGDKVVITSVD